MGGEDGAAVGEAQSALPAVAHGARFLAATLAYRAWALANPAPFALIFGTTIPDYHAPREATVPAVRDAFATLLAAPRAAYATHEAGDAATSDGEQTNAAVDRAADHGFPPEVFSALVEGWGEMHGLVMLELFGHLRPVVPDTAAFFAAAMRRVAARAGLPPPDE